MTTRSWDSNVSAVGSEPKQILRNSMAATVKSICVNETDFAAQFPQVRRIDYFWRDNLDVLANKPWIDA